MRIIKNFAAILLVLLCCYTQGQNQFQKWYFGNYAGLDFSTSPPTAITNGSLYTSEGVASICDNSGNLLFYTDGVTVKNSTHAVMANGAGLLGENSSTQSAIIVKQPGNSNLYFVFTVPVETSNLPVAYSIVDMSLAAGLGSVTVKNYSLYTIACEKQVAVRHCNGKDIWIVSHEYNTNNFRAYLLTAAGVNAAPVISSTGGAPAGDPDSKIGHLKASPDGRKLAMATAINSIPSALGKAGFDLFDFDAATGVVSNSLTLTANIASIGLMPYGVEFSPDGTKLYGTAQPTVINSPSVLFQWNICAGSPVAIIASQYTVSTGLIYPVYAGALQWAIDGKIYIAAYNLQSLSVINSPNNSGVAMNYSGNAVSLASKTCFFGLPNYIHNSPIKPAPLPFTTTVTCQNASFAAQPVISFTNSCGSNTYAPSGYLWDFGDPSSGANNTSTLSTPVHVYSATGSYTASLIFISPCTSDTVKKVITVTTPGPAPSVSGPTVICEGDINTYSVTGGASYLWSINAGGGNSSTAILQPSITTAYSVWATSNGCTSAQGFTVIVKPVTAPVVTGPTTVCNGDRYTYTVTGGSSYSWSGNAGGGSAITTILQPSTTTVYSVSATNNGCTSMLAFTLTVKICTGIEGLEVGQPEWEVYPNPVSENLLIENKKNKSLNIRVCNLPGEIVFERKSDETRTEIDMSDFKSGIYFIYIESKKSWVIKKVIKE